MNFQELYKRINNIDKGIVAECGDMPGDMMHPPKQQDNVTMNVSMNGSGTGGIKDLMDILKNIESGGHDHQDAAVLVGDREIGEEVDDGGFGDATTSPNEVTLDIDSVIPTGDDLHSHGGNEVEKVNGGGNPYTNVGESLQRHLHDLYTEVKSR